MKKIVTIDGNEACSNTAYMFTELSGIYPITPSSNMSENVDKWSNEGRLNLFGSRVEVVEMQSEAGAIGLVHGSLQSGLFATTFTSSQGLLLMLPNMYKIAGEMLPSVIHVSARSLSTHALSILGDHQDVYAARTTGYCMLFSSSVQDSAYLSGVAHLSTISSSLPFMHIHDGFRTSNELTKVNLLTEEDFEPLIDQEKVLEFRNRALSPLRPVTRGTNQNDDIYFQATEVRNVFYNKVPDIVNEYMNKINEITNSNYQPFNYYGSDSAEEIIVAMGSVCETIKETIDYLNNNNYNVGLIEVHLYRPFSKDYFLNVLPKSVKKIAVLDRTKEHGSTGEPLFLDVVSILSDQNIKIVGGRYGLSSKNTNPSQIKAVYDMLKKELKNNFTIGINDDLTNLSLKLEPLNISDSNEILIYGYGSDGMVSASKSFSLMISENTDKFIQGYFEYDSKKSGGVTTTHIRVNDKPIRSTYYVENPDLIVVSKESYLFEFDCLSKIKENGIIIINTAKEQNVLELVPDDIKYALNKKNVKIYTLNAFELARKVGLKNKISMIMEEAILLLTNYIDYSTAHNLLQNDIKTRFSNKGEDIVNSNLEAINSVKTYLKEIVVEAIDFIDIKEKDVNVFDYMNSRKGNDLPVSAFLNNPDGTFEAGTSIKEKKGISDIVPKWINENCIQCNQCSFVCPHGVIRGFLLDEEEYNNAPEEVKSRCLRPMEKHLQQYYYMISISVKNCTGCGLCVRTCPGKQGNKALEMTKIEAMIEAGEQEVFDYLLNNVKDKGLDTNTIKTSQFKKPEFCFHGACAGCGETSYIKLLTQLVGKKLVIANATGCSSIYGGNIPTTPYSVSWASSLFEDNAEYGLGMTVSYRLKRQIITNFMEENKDKDPLFTKWLENKEDFDITKEIYEQLDYKKYPVLDINKEYIVSRSIWTIGGDGWAYDIGFGGIDHVLSSNEKARILILDTQVYSNTGGQSSKASPIGSIAAFTSTGKMTNQKDLAKIALAYPNVYVATISLGANMMQTLKALKEAENYDGPAIIIAYSPCIAHGIKGGLNNTTERQKLAVQSGYFPIFRYNSLEDKMIIDYKNVNFDLYEDFLNDESRYSLLKKINQESASELLEKNKQDAIKRFEYYKSLVKETSD